LPWLPPVGVTAAAIEQNANKIYPMVPQVLNEINIIDEFQRATLNNADAPLLYTADGEGAETIGIISGQLSLLTGATDTNNADCRTTSLFPRRQSPFIGKRSTWTLDVIFNLNEITDTAGFIGLDARSAAITVNPNTQEHIGLIWNPAVINDIRLSVADGTNSDAQDTAGVLQTGALRLNIVYAPDSSIVLSIFDFDGVTFDNLRATFTPSPAIITMNNIPMMLHFYIEAESNAARNLLIHEWRYTWSGM